jgi:hypothetical protein
MRAAGLGGSPQGRVKIINSIGKRTIGIVREDVEHPLAGNDGPAGHGRACLGVVDIDDMQTRARVENQIRTLGVFELPPKLANTGRIERCGKGGPGDPFTYYPAQTVHHYPKDQPGRDDQNRPSAPISD